MVKTSTKTAKERRKFLDKKSVFVLIYISRFTDASAGHSGMKFKSFLRLTDKSGITTGEQKTDFKPTVWAVLKLQDCPICF